MQKISSVKSILCSNPDSIFRYFAWPSVTRLPDGALAMVCSGFRIAHLCPFGKAVICYSRDEGRTWSYPATLIDTPLDDRDPSLAVFGNGRAILSCFNLPVSLHREHIEKKAFPEQRNLIEAYLACVEASGIEEKYLGCDYRISEDGGYTFGAPRPSPVTAPHGPIRLNDGSLLYIGRTVLPKGVPLDEKSPILSAWKLNDQDEFVQLGEIENLYDEYGWMLSEEPHALQLPSGRIIVHIRAQREEPHREFTLYQCESDDEGRTFTKPHQILSHLGGSPSHLMQHSSGRIIASYGYREHPCGIRIMFSDDGMNWSEPYILEEGCQGGDMGYPATVELKDGSLLTVYYESTYYADRPEEASIMQRVWKLP